MAWLGLNFYGFQIFFLMIDVKRGNIQGKLQSESPKSTSLGRIFWTKCETCEAIRNREWFCTQIRGDNVQRSAFKITPYKISQQNKNGSHRIGVASACLVWESPTETLFWFCCCQIVTFVGCNRNFLKDRFKPEQRADSGFVHCQRAARWLTLWVTKSVRGFHVMPGRTNNH